jgi:hypothetical protein
MLNGVLQTPSNQGLLKDVKKPESLDPAPSQDKACSSMDCTLELGNLPKPSITYEKPKHESYEKEIERLIKEADEAIMPLRRLVEELLHAQGLTYKNATFDINEEDMVYIDEETRAKAQQLISEGGAMSVENTAQRLFDFAVAVSGGDKSKIETLKSNISQGFEAAKEILGGHLPEISYQTYARTLEKLNEWAQS